MIKIAVLQGGWSPERPISLQSGENIANWFRKLGYETYQIDVPKNLKLITEMLYEIDPDYIYNALHGIGGEDGVIQGILEVFGKPYSNSNVLGSAICFDKSTTKRIAQSVGVITPHYIEISACEITTLDPDAPPIQYPFVIKPSANGSSIGVHLIHSSQDLINFQHEDWEFGNSILLEQYIPGREFSVLVIDNQVMGSVEITYKNQFYDYKSKYDKGGSSHIADYQMPQQDIDKMYQTSQIIYKACKCKGIARIDFRYDGHTSYFIEINTQPGMTATSLVPDIIRFKRNILFEDILLKDLKDNIST